MKKLFFFLSFCLFNFISHAQAPQGIPYQSVVRNASGALLTNQPVSIRFSIHDSTMQGTIVYQETHNTTTSNGGMVILNIGQGTPLTGIFSAINWGVNAKFMQVELDTTATGNNYVDLGTQALMSVPYALYAGSAGKIVLDTNYIFNKHGYLNLMNDTVIIAKKDIDMEITMSSGKGGNGGAISYTWWYGGNYPWNSGISPGGKGITLRFLIKLFSGDTLYLKIDGNNNAGNDGCSSCVPISMCIPYPGSVGHYYNIYGGLDGIDGNSCTLSINDSSLNNYVLKCSGGIRGIGGNMYGCGNFNGGATNAGSDGFIIYGNQFMNSSAVVLDSKINNNQPSIILRW